MSKAVEVRESIQSCTKCSLHKVSNGPVPFRGRRSPVMVLGEAPGRTEDEIGRPFVGPAGKFLWRELHRVGVERRDVFSANAVSCYPQRTPNEVEILCCRYNLYRQIELCQPEYILALGRVPNWSLRARDPMLGDPPLMNQLHGQWYALPSIPLFQMGDPAIFATYHPSAVLRNRALMRRWREDLQVFAEIAGGVDGA